MVAHPGKSERVAFSLETETYSCVCMLTQARRTLRRDSIKPRSVKDESSLWSDFGLFGKDTDGMLQQGNPGAGAEMYLQHVRAKMAGGDMSWQSSRMSIRS